MPEEDEEFIAPEAVLGKKIEPEVRKKLRSFLCFKDLENKFVYRNTGTVNGHGFAINKCTNCDLYLEDRTN